MTCPYRYGLSSLAFTAVLTLTAAGASAAPSQPPKPSDNDFIPAEMLEQMRKQEPFSRAAHNIRQEIEQSGATGFAGMRMDGDELVLQWQGAVPASVLGAVSQASSVMSVRVESRPHSWAQLKQEAQKLKHLVRANDAPSAPLRAIIVTQEGKLRLEPLPDADVLALRETLPATQVPVEIVPATQDVSGAAGPRERSVASASPLVTAWRGDDMPRWSGGAHINARRNNFHRYTCSSGFSIRNRATGYPYMLTAAHCGTYPDEFHDGPPNQKIGPIAYEDWRLDILIVAAPAGVNGNIYWGSAATSVTKNIGGWEWVNPPDWLCASGMRSGTKCGLRPTGNWAAYFYITDSDGDRIRVEDMVELYNSMNECPAIPNDSGGPVVSLIDGGFRLLAKGIMVARDENDCRRVWIQDFGTVQARYNIVPAVGG